MSSKN